MTNTRRPAGWADSQFPAIGASVLLAVVSAVGLWFAAFSADGLADPESPGGYQRGIAWGGLLVAASAMTFALWRARAMSREIRIARHELREHETRAKVALAWSELAALVESSGDAMITKDLNDVVVSWNASAERMLGYRADEMIGSTIRRIIPERLWQEETQIRERVVRGERVHHFETVRMRKDGAVLDTSMSVSPIKDADGSIVGTSKVMRDITERKRTEDALRESEGKLRALTAELESRVETSTAQLKTANRELEAFSYSVSHDLRAPLRAVDGFSRILLEDHAEQLDAEGKRLLDVVRSNTRQMGQLIDDLLSFSRVGRQEMARTAVDMRALADAAFRGLVAADEKVSFTVGDLPHADVDPALMRQVWVNLISNALKFSRPRTERVIEIAGRTEPGRVVYSVKDNGVGFDMAYRNKLFGVFQRLHSSHEFQGTGVGLALVQRIVQRHGGEVWGEGRVGEGATFSFSLPAGGSS